MRLSDEERAQALEWARRLDEECPSGHWPYHRLALDLADELAAMTDAWVGAELREESLRYELAAAQAHAERFMRDLRKAERREKRLKRQVELMGWLIQSHETDIHELRNESLYYKHKEQPYPTFDQMGDPSDEGEYTDDDLDMMKDHWPAAAEELLRRQMAADNPGGRDAEAEHTWRNR